MLRSTVDAMPWTDDFLVRPEAVPPSVTLTCDPTGEACSAAFKAVVDTAIQQRLFMSTLNATHSELFLLPGARTTDGTPVCVERFAGDLFGIIGRGAHLTAFTRTGPGKHDMKIWVPRRSESSFTFPGKLDSTVAGGVPAHQTPWENLLMEADEEASFPRELIERDARAAGVLTYAGLSSEGMGEGYVASDVVYVYDLEVGAEVVPAPKDGEVKEFHLMGVAEAREAMARGEFKTNSAVVLVDFFVRHGVLSEETEGREFVEVVQRMHRRLPVAASSRGG